MGTSIKTLRKVAVKRESSPGSYLDPDTMLNATNVDFKQSFSAIPDEAILGVAFRDTPAQGVRTVTGKIDMEVDVLSVAPMLVAAFGDTSSPYSLATSGNAEAMSVCVQNEVKLDKYTAAYVKAFSFNSTQNQKLKATFEMLVWKIEDRSAASWPSISVNPGTILNHHHARSTGYMRIGDQADALSAGDNMGLEELSFGCDWGFADQYDNTDQGTLIPLWGTGGRPSCTLSFKISRHAADTFLAWRDAATLLQLESYWYASATAALKIQIPNFKVLDVEVTGDDVPRIQVTAQVGRNGIGTSYVNAYMTFVNPIVATLTNS